MSVPLLSKIYKSTDLSPQDVYNISRGNAGDWGIDGYSPPKKTGILTYRDPTFPKSPRSDIFNQTKRSKQPDSQKYSPTHLQLSKIYWEKPSGKFTQDRRKTVIDQIIKQSSKLPGPGSYWSQPKQQTKSPQKLSGFRMKKQSGFNFLSNTEFLGQETPGVGKYFSSEESRNKAFNQTEKRIKGFKFTSIKANIKKEQSPVGPGYIKDLEAHQKKHSRYARSPSYMFNKSVSPGILSDTARNSKFVPGVGHYKDVDRAFNNSVIIKKTRAASISKSSLSRNTETEAKKKQWVPGPGSYNIMPPLRRK